jgi:membrane protein involved in colicin uptake
MKIKILKTSCFEHQGKHKVYQAGEVHEMDDVLAAKALASGYCQLSDNKAEAEREKQRVKAEKEAAAKAEVEAKEKAKVEAEAAELAAMEAEEAAKKEKMLGADLSNKMLTSEQNKDGL